MLGVQILETRTEAPEVLGALGTLSTFYNENTPAARRSLRSNIDKRGLQIDEEFLAAAGSVIQVPTPCCNVTKRGAPRALRLSMCCAEPMAHVLTGAALWH